MSEFTVICAAPAWPSDHNMIDKLAEYCQTNGISLVSHTQGNRMELTFINSGNSGAFRVLEAYVTMREAMERV